MLKRDFGNVPIIEGTQLNRLRDEFHTWTFENVRRIEHAYRSLYPRTTERADEIMAPLAVMAALADDTELSRRLEIALARQRQAAVPTDDPQQLVHEALKNLIAQGYQTVSPTHVTLEVRRLIMQSEHSSGAELPTWLRPGWVGRLLHGLDVFAAAANTHSRIRLFGLNLRFFKLGESYLAEAKEWFAARGINIPTGTKEPTEFCSDCESCPYSTLHCEIMQQRQAAKRLFGGARKAPRGG
jgi:hypothetical protein